MKLTIVKGISSKAIFRRPSQKHIKRALTTALALSTLFICQPSISSAEETLDPTASNISNLGLDVWGLSYHTNRNIPNQNEKNWGLGIDYRVASLTNDIIRTSFGAGFFKDTLSNTSKYAGLKITYKVTDFLGVGISPFLMSRPNYNNGSVFFAATPLLRLHYHGVAANFTYIPKVLKYSLRETYAVFFTIPLSLPK